MDIDMSTFKNGDGGLYISYSRPACLDCKHYIGSLRIEDSPDLRNDYFCKAFPDGEGIPFRIWASGSSRKKSVPCARGFHFEPKEDEDEVYKGESSPLVDEIIARFEREMKEGL